MDLTNRAVIHKTYGDGKIVRVSNEYITVLFSAGEKRFMYPAAFGQHLSMKDADCATYVQAEIAALNAKEAEAAEQKRRLEIIQREALAASAVKNSKPAKKGKEVPRSNIAFKCNYCDGGKSAAQVGFNGVCSEEVIRNNIEVEGRTWCSDASCACLQYHHGEMDREALDRKCRGDGFVCAESQMLREWRAFAGAVLSGDRKGKPMKLPQVQKNSLCVLTTRDPDSAEADRYIFAVFLVDEAYEGDNRKEGYVATKSKYKIKLSPDEAHRMLFWNYHVNDNQPDIAAWNSGLHRYFEDPEAVQILRDVAVVKAGTADEELATDFLSHFITINGVDREAVPDKNGALIRAAAAT